MSRAIQGNVMRINDLPTTAWLPALAVLVICLLPLRGEGAAGIAVEGQVSAVVSDTSFQMLDGLITVDSSAARLEGIKSVSDIAVGMVIEAEGDLEPGGRIRATTIEFENEDDDGLQSEIEGGRLPD